DFVGADDSSDMRSVIADLRLRLGLDLHERLDELPMYGAPEFQIIGQSSQIFDQNVFFEGRFQAWVDQLLKALLSCLRVSAFTEYPDIVQTDDLAIVAEVEARL